MRWMECQNKLPVKNYTAVANCEKVVCSACEFGKASKQPDGATKTNLREDKQSEIKKEDLLPGQRVSIYHYQLSVTD